MLCPAAKFPLNSVLFFMTASTVPTFRVVFFYVLCTCCSALLCSALLSAFFSQGKSNVLGFDTSFSKFQDFRNDREKRDFVACGAAAGVAAAFGAPIGECLRFTVLYCVFLFSSFFFFPTCLIFCFFSLWGCVFFFSFSGALISYFLGSFFFCLLVVFLILFEGGVGASLSSCFYRFLSFLRFGRRFPPLCEVAFAL